MISLISSKWQQAKARAAEAVIRLLKFDPKRVSVSFAEDTCRTVALPGRERRYTLTHNDLTRHLTLSVASDFNGGQTDIWYTRLLRDEVLAEWREDGLHVHCNVSVEGHWWISWAKSLRALVFRQKLPLVLDTLRYAERDLLMTSPHLLKAPVYVNFHGDDGNGDGSAISLYAAGWDGSSGGGGDDVSGTAAGTPGAMGTVSSGTSAGGVVGDGDAVDDGGGGGGSGGDDENERWTTSGVRECWGPLGDAGVRGRVGESATAAGSVVVAGGGASGSGDESEEVFSRARDLWSIGEGEGEGAGGAAQTAQPTAAAGVGGGGGGGGGGMSATGASGARSFAKKSVVGVSSGSGSAGVDDIDALGSAAPVAKRVISR